MKLNNLFSKKALSYNAPIFICLLMAALLLIIPTGFEDVVQYKTAERCIGRVTATDNSDVIDTGLVRSGEQRCSLTILNGIFKDCEIIGVNMLHGSLEQDKLFSDGDIAQIVVSHNNDNITNVTMIDHYRIPYEIIMAAAFVLLLIIFAKRTGVRAILSFVLTILAIWKLLIPAYLRGENPIFIGLAVTFLLTVLIIALVYGFDRRCASAVSGAFLGILVTCVLGIVFTDLFKIHGAVMSYSESLLYSGYQNLNLTQIFMASIFIGSSGAVMDLSVDITSAVHEVIIHRPDISCTEAIISGMHIGRSAMGTMTTTLLLAYSGGYVALLMVFMAQGTPIEHILNYKYVSSELIHTIIGSFGLVTVAPFTALCAGILLTKRQPKTTAIQNDNTERSE